MLVDEINTVWTFSENVRFVSLPNNPEYGKSFLVRVS